MTQQDKVNKRTFLKFSGVFKTLIYDIKKSRSEIRRLINNFEVLNISDQIYLILILSTRYTFIYNVYGNVSFFI